MGKQDEVREVRGVRFKIAHLPYEIKKKMFVRIAKTYGPAYSRIGMGLTTSNATLFSAAAGEMFAALEERDLDYLVDTFCEFVSFEGANGKWPSMTKENRLALFEDDFMLPFQLVKECAEVNFGDFLDALAPKEDDDQDLPEEPESPLKL